MKLLTIALTIFLLFGCTDSNSPPWLVSKMRKEHEEQRKEAALTQFTPENFTRNPSWRTLLPANAIYRPYPALRTYDSWVVSDSLNDVAAWYRSEMKRRGFVGSLRQCTPDSIYGGRIVIIDYCSASHYIDLRLADDNILDHRVIRVDYSPRGSFDCSAEALKGLKLQTQGCPVELLP